MESEFRNELRTTLETFIEPGSTFEVRIPKVEGKKRTDSGYFDDIEHAITAIARYDGRAAGVYVTINPVDPALLARAANRVQHFAELTTTDAYIKKRRWLFIDIDPQRPAGISSTDAEHEAALARARYIRDMLQQTGWPAPVLGDSGNGTYLFYRIDLPNDQASSDKLHRVLNALAALVNDTTVEIDTGVFNASRIAKILGTLACKGDNTPTRPHRRSRLLEVPDMIEVVSIDLLDALAAEVAPPSPQPAHSPSGAEFDIEAFITRHSLPVEAPKPWHGGTLWQLEACPFNADHHGTARIIKLPSGALSFSCFHNSCQDKKWRDLREKLEPGCYTQDSSHGQVITSSKTLIRTDAISGISGISGTQGDPESNDTPDTTEYPEPWPPPIPLLTSNVPPFPTHIFPAWLQTYVEAEAETTQTPPDLTAMLVLAVLATVNQKKVRIYVKPGHVEPVNLYTITAMVPGSRKSPVYKDVVAPLEAFEAEAIQRQTLDIALAQNEYKILEGRLAKKQQEAMREQDDGSRAVLQEEAQALVHELASKRVPVLPRLIADDVTPERLASMLAEQGGRMAVLSSEGDIFDVMAGRYGHGTPNFGVFLKGHAGDTLRVDRGNRDAEYVYEPALTLGLTVQPDVIHGLTQRPGFRGRGLLGRFLYAIPEDQLGRRRVVSADMPARVRADYEYNITTLLKLPFGTNERGEIASHILRFSPAAYLHFQQFAEWLEPQLAATGDLGHMTDWAAKLAGAVARIAALLHMATYATHPAPWQLPIEAATVDAAITVAQYLIAHARAAYAAMGADPDIADAEYALRHIEKRSVTEFSKRDLWHWTKVRFKKVDKLEPVLKVLMAHGFIRERPPPPRTGRGQPPSPVYEVNPSPPDQKYQKYQNSASSVVPGGSELTIASINGKPLPLPQQVAAFDRYFKAGDTGGARRVLHMLPQYNWSKQEQLLAEAEVSA